MSVPWVNRVWIVQRSAESFTTQQEFSEEKGKNLSTTCSRTTSWSWQKAFHVIKASWASSDSSGSRITPRLCTCFFRRSVTPSRSHPSGVGNQTLKVINLVWISLQSIDSHPVHDWISRTSSAATPAELCVISMLQTMHFQTPDDPTQLFSWRC